MPISVSLQPVGSGPRIVKLVEVEMVKPVLAPVPVTVIEYAPGATFPFELKVRVLVPTFVIDAGLKLALNPLGNPLTESATVSEKPRVGATITEIGGGTPAAPMQSAVGKLNSPKPAPELVTVTLPKIAVLSLFGSPDDTARPAVTLDSIGTVAACDWAS